MQNLSKQVAANGLGDNRPHFVLVPFMAQGHMIPMVDMAHLIAGRGAVVSFITTPVNAARIRPVIDRVEAEGLPIRFVSLEFPWARGGLPEGCENVDLVPSRDLFNPFFKALRLLTEPLEIFLQEVKPSPSCMIVDYCNPWTSEVAHKLNIPRFIFHGPSCFFIFSIHNIRTKKVYDGVEDFEPVVVPDLAQRVEITKAQAPGWFAGWIGGPEWDDVRNSAIEAEASADGIAVNTFDELEFDIVERYKKVIAKPVWPIGPLSLYNKDIASKASRGKKSVVDENQVINWLDSMESNSVIYVSFGSIARVKASQLIEIGSGLEASNCPFIWVLKELDMCPEIKKWMLEGFKERTKERSLIITGWAPQVVILSHPSIGGFITHCGWNSTLEAISIGVPMITWPFFADQFLNEKLVVEVLKISIPIGVKIPYYHSKAAEVLVKREDVEKAISNLINGSEECKERWERVKMYAKKAQKAMEGGGSSYNNLTLLFEYILESSKEE